MFKRTKAKKLLHSPTTTIDRTFLRFTSSHLKIHKHLAGPYYQLQIDKTGCFKQ